MRHSLKLKLISKRINRYIMECKFVPANSKYFFIFELIDTLWNVNTKRKEFC